MHAIANKLDKQVNKRYQTNVSWVQETHPPIYNFSNQKLGQFTASHQLEGYEYGRQVGQDKIIAHIDFKVKDGSKIPIKSKSLFINQEEYESEVNKRFKKNPYPQKEFIRPLISFKHYEKFIETNATQTLTDKKSRDQIQDNSQNKINQHSHKNKSYNIQHIYDLNERQQERASQKLNQQSIHEGEDQNKKTESQLHQNNNLHVLNNDNKLTLKDVHLNYIANNIDALQNKINKLVN